MAAKLFSVFANKQTRLTRKMANINAYSTRIACVNLPKHAVKMLIVTGSIAALIKKEEILHFVM